MVSRPTGVPDDMATQLTRLLGATRPTGIVSVYVVNLAGG